jgi:hypothetical protein
MKRNLITAIIAANCLCWCGVLHFIILTQTPQVSMNAVVGNAVASNPGARQTELGRIRDALSQQRTLPPAPPPLVLTRPPIPPPPTLLPPPAVQPPPAAAVPASQLANVGAARLLIMMPTVPRSSGVSYVEKAAEAIIKQLVGTPQPRRRTITHCPNAQHHPREGLRGPLRRVPASGQPTVPKDRCQAPSCHSRPWCCRGRERRCRAPGPHGAVVPP